MKRITLFFLIITSFAIAQKQSAKFEASKDGFIDYVVLEFDGKTANEIYSEIQKWAQYNIRNSKDAKYSEIQDEYVGYSLFVDKAIKVDASYGIDYDLELRVKDGKLRIDIDIKSMPLALESSGADLTFSKGLNSMFKNNGEPRTLKDRQLKRQAVEDFANGLVESINDAVSGRTNKKDDW